MPENKNNQLVNQVRVDNENFFVGLYNNLRLIFRLIKDSRISFLLKILPIGALIYLITPTDILPLNPLDDGFVLWLGGYLFIELCPEDIVAEHRKALQHAPDKGLSVTDDDEAVEGAYREVPPSDTQ